MSIYIHASQEHEVSNSATSLSVYKLADSVSFHQQSCSDGRDNS